MAEEYVSRHEHEEFRRSMESENKRLEEENNRQNHRLDGFDYDFFEIVTYVFQRCTIQMCDAQT